MAKTALRFLTQAVLCVRMVSSKLLCLDQRYGRSIASAHLWVCEANPALEQGVAIYSLHHSSIGKATQEQPYTAAAHLDYITRERAMSRSEAGGFPTTKKGGMRFLRSHEDRARANGRVADKILVALPRELNPDQRAELVREFVTEVTKGKAPWFAAFHDKGKDASNPHCHLILCDKDPATGRRVFQTTEKGSTERLRILWEKHANAALARAQRPERIDHRSLQAQGIKRKPTIHVGVTARHLIRDSYIPMSRVRMLRNSCLARSPVRRVAYPAIDAGQLRLAHNIEIRRTNLKASIKEDREAEYWTMIDEDAFARDIREMRRLHAVLEFSDDRKHVHRTRDLGWDYDR